MFNTIKEFIRKVVSKIFNKETIQKAVNVDIAMSNEMYTKKQLWQQIYEDKAPWLSNTVSSMNVGAGVASELARLVTIEFQSEISNNDFLNKEYQAVIDNIRNYTEYACAGGGVCFKPYVSDGHIEVDVVQAINFFPTAYNSRGEITGCILPETMTKGDTTYIRIEYHNFNNGEHTIINRAFKQKNLGNFNLSTQSLGDEIPLAEVEEWANITPEVTIRNIERPLFSYFKMPLANTIDSTSPEGVSVYARVAKDLLKKVDEQYSRIIWEFESKETAIDASKDFFKKDNEGNPILPTGKERLYRALNIMSSEDRTSGWNIFSPEIRDKSMFNGLNELLRQVEFLSGLAYGTISKEVETAKTATEIKTSKQRSYQMVKDIQKSLQISLEGLIYAMQVWGQIAQLGVNPVNIESDVSFNFDDSIIVDKESEMQKLFLYVTSGILKPEYLLKKEGFSEEDIKKYMENQTVVKGDPFANSQE